MAGSGEYQPVSSGALLEEFRVSVSVSANPEPECVHPAALLVFLPWAAGAGIVAANLGVTHPLKNAKDAAPSSNKTEKASHPPHLDQHSVLAWTCKSQELEVPEHL